jgi:hypothetical protein
LPADGSVIVPDNDPKDDLAASILRWAVQRGRLV